MATVTYPSQIAAAHFLEHGPESKIGLLDQRLVIGNSRAALCYLMSGGGAPLAVSLAPPALWWAALRRTFRPPFSSHDYARRRGWAAQYQNAPELLVAGPRQTGRHHDIRTALLMGLFMAADRSDFGRVFGRDFVMRLGEDGLTPDVLLVARAKLGRLYEYYLDGDADLVIEVLLPEHAAYDRGTKARLYAAGGIPQTGSLILTRGASGSAA